VARPPSKTFPPYPVGPVGSSKQARIKIHGVPYYLGKWGSPQSYAKYAEYAEQFAQGHPIPPPSGRPQLNLNELVETYYFEEVSQNHFKDGKQGTKPRSIRAALKPVVVLFGTKQAADFDSADFIACRKWLATKGKGKDGKITRKRVNDHLNRIKAMFHWAIKMGHVPEGIA